MISQTNLEPVNAYKAALGKVLSVYLDVDQSNAENLNRRFEAVFESKIKQLGNTVEDNDRLDFDSCAAEARKLLAAYKPCARGLVIFARSTGLIWLRELHVPVVTAIYWAPTVHLQQFVEALDEFETYAVLLSDKVHSRVFTIKLGAIEKQGEVHAVSGVRHVKSAGMDHLFSQSHMHRKADENILSHWKRAVELLEHVSRSTPFDRLVLAGAAEATSELFRLLPKAMRAKVVVSAPIAADAPEADIVEEILLISRKAERTLEVETAEALTTASAKGRNGVTGLAGTLEALNEKRVRELVYAEGDRMVGGVCETCECVFPSASMNCGVCGLPVKPVDDLIEKAIDVALAEGATIEQLRGEAAEKLRAAGAIGAFLRY